MCDGKEIVPMKMLNAVQRYEPKPSLDNRQVEYLPFQLYGNEEGCNASSSSCSATKTASHLEIVVSPASNSNEQSNYQQVIDEWRLVAIVIDRFLFWIFLIVSTVVSAVILLVQPLTKPSPI